MIDLLNALLVIVLAMNLFALGTSRILSVIRIVAAQGALLGALPLLMHQRLSLPVAIAAVAAVALKGIVMPSIMMRALRDAPIKREVEPLIGLLPSIILGALATAFALLIRDLSLAPIGARARSSSRLPCDDPDRLPAANDSVQGRSARRSAT